MNVGARGQRSGGNWETPQKRSVRARRIANLGNRRFAETPTRLSGVSEDRGGSGSWLTSVPSSLIVGSSSMLCVTVRGDRNHNERAWRGREGVYLCANSDPFAMVLYDLSV